MTREEKEQKARQQFIEEVQNIGGRLTIQQAVEIIRRYDLNPRRDKAVYDSDARLARDWLADEVDDKGERIYHNIKRTNDKGEVIQEFVQELLFDVDDYKIKTRDETKAFKHSYKKITQFVGHCFERYGVKLKVDLSFIKPIHFRRSKRAERSGAKARDMFDELNP